MLYYLTAVLLAGHAIFWGAGLAGLILPRAWRPAWWCLAAPLGWALQSAVVWAGAKAGLAGTAAYGWWAELLPLVLLALAWRRLRLSWTPARPGLVAVLAAIALGGALLLWPMAQRGAWTLTTSSLGSCDQADYAAGARVLQEFSRTDRVGFLDLPEVTRIGGVERFFDYWIELNHFSPSAVIALNGAVFGLEPHQLVSVTAAVFWLMTAPLAVLLARVAGWRRGTRAVAALMLAVSPLGAYAVHHGALGQMLAMQGTALLTLVVAAASRAGGWAAAGRFAPVAFAAFWLLAGSYNFFLAIAVAPALVAAVLGAARSGRWAGFGRTVALLAAALAACAAVFWERFAGIAERFRLLERYDFGWPVPLLTPEAWAGLVRDELLNPWGGAVRVALAAVVVVAAGAGAVRLARRRGTGGLMLGWVATVAGGWAVLAWESRVRANASYDAFKVVTVFLPLLVPVVFAWFAAAVRPRWWAWGGLAGVLALGAVAQREFVAAAANPPLRVDRHLLDLRRLERLPHVGSLNLRIEDFWSRLWANALLLERAQYFPTHTYEARLNTPLRGEWDLKDARIRSLPADERDHVVLNHRFHAVRCGAPGLVEATIGAGWHQRENDRGLRWRWASGARAEVKVHNPSSRPVRVAVEMRARGVRAGEVRAAVGAQRAAAVPIAREWGEVELGTFTLPPGGSVIELFALQPAQPGGPGDARRLTFAVADMTLRALRD